MYEKIKKADKKKEIVYQDFTKERLSTDFSNIQEFITLLYNSIVKDDLDEKKRDNYTEKIVNEATNLTRSKGLEILLKESDGVIILPEYYDEKKRKQISKMVLKKLRLESSKSNLKDYKKIRLLDKSKFEHKRDFYFDKDSYTN